MERREVSDSIRASWAFTERAGLAEFFASSEPLPVSSQFRDLILEGRSDHIALYSHCLKTSHYNILLFDHSFFQYSWTAPDEVRYAFYPNPHVSGDDALHRFRRYREMVVDGSISEDEFSQLTTAMQLHGYVPVYRYENAPTQYRSLAHPCSHLHIGIHDSNRWAVRRVLSPLAFTMLLIKHYYHAEWSQGVPEGSITGENLFEEELARERARCPLVDGEKFSEEEERTFYLA